MSTISPVEKQQQQTKCLKFSLEEKPFLFLLTFKSVFLKREPLERESSSKVQRDHWRVWPVSSLSSFPLIFFYLFVYKEGHWQLSRKGQEKQQLVYSRVIRDPQSFKGKYVTTRSFRKNIFLWTVKGGDLPCCFSFVIQLRGRHFEWGGGQTGHVTFVNPQNQRMNWPRPYSFFFQY